MEPWCSRERKNKKKNENDIVSLQFTLLASWERERERKWLRERHKKIEMTPELYVSESIRLARAQKFILPGSSIFSSCLLFHCSPSTISIFLVSSISVFVSTYVYADIVLLKKLIWQSTNDTHTHFQSHSICNENESNFIHKVITYWRLIKICRHMTAMSTENISGIITTAMCSLLLQKVSIFIVYAPSYKKISIK